MRPLRRLSIRWRITIGTLVIAAVVSSIAVFGFRAQVEHILATTTTTVLQHDAAPYVSEISATPPHTVDAPGRGQLVAVIDPDGVLVVSDLPSALTAKLGDPVAFGSVARTVAVGDDHYRVLSQAVATDAGSWHVVSARNEDSSTLLLDNITQALIVVAVLLVLVFGIASWLLTSAALRPVNRMRRQAEALVADGSTEPLPIGPARDELSALAMTLNEFIADVRESVVRERQLVSDASHELRTPLAILMTQLELAHLASGDAVALEQEIEDAQRSVARISALATGLLQLSQLEQPATGGRQESTAEQLSDELAAAADRARLLAAPTGVTIDFEVTWADADSRYAMSADAFGRLVGNLTGNSLVAVDDGGWIRIDLSPATRELELIVSDSGPGMPEDFMPTAFDRFSRPDSSRSTRTGGAGLGLAIVQAIVASAGGSVELANAEGAGLVVTVRIPALP